MDGVKRSIHRKTFCKRLKIKGEVLRESEKVYELYDRKKNFRKYTTLHRRRDQKWLPFNKKSSNFEDSYKMV